MDKTKKKNLRRYILWGVMALVVAVLAVMPLMARQQQAEDGPVASILSDTARVSSIRTAVHGGGTLEAGDAEDVEVPYDVKITEFLVKNGDMVSEGDPLAEVDKVSVMTAITQVRDSMEIVAGQIESYSDEKADTTVTATAGGRVKAVYAKKGDRVETVLLEHGALAVLSLDGRMSVKIAALSALSNADSVNVTLADGTSVTGRVESNLNGEVIVTIEDKGYDAGQTVTVENLGTGTLEIHSPWSATAFTGTISQVSVKEEQVLSSGATLFTLKDTDYTAQRELLANTHREYEELLQKLFQMYETGVISAPCDGMVSGIDSDSTHLLAAEEGEFTIQLLSAREEDYQLVLLSDETCTNSENCPLTGTDPNHQEGCPKACTRSEGCTADTHFSDCIHACTKADSPEKCPATGKHYAQCIKSCTSATTEGACPATEHHYHSCIESCISSDGTTECPATGVHKKACIKSCVRAEVAGVCKAGHHYTDCIESCVSSPNSGTPCPASKHKTGCYYYGATFYAQVFKVSAVGTTELVGFTDGISYEVVKTGSGWSRADGQPFDTTLLTQRTNLPVANAGQFQEGDVVLVITGKKGEETFSMGTVLYSRITMPDITIPSFTMPSFSFSFTMPSMGIGGTSGQSQLFDLNGDVLMTVTPQDTMTLTISVDETDISSLHTGMIAEVTVTALQGEEFEGEITRIASSGSGNGGSSKFAVELELPRESEMLAGMSASAVIPLYEKMDVLTVPSAALVEDGGKTIVYTALDKKTGEPSAPVEVTTGISDGETVEILSGLSSGDSIYYRYYDTLEESDAVETDRFQMY